MFAKKFLWVYKLNKSNRQIMILQILQSLPSGAYPILFVTGALFLWLFIRNHGATAPDVYSENMKDLVKNGKMAGRYETGK
jgi:hypothetical protein